MARRRGRCRRSRRAGTAPVTSPSGLRNSSKGAPGRRRRAEVASGAGQVDRFSTSTASGSAPGRGPRCRPRRRCPRRSRAGRSLGLQLLSGAAERLRQRAQEGGHVVADDDRPEPGQARRRPCPGPDGSWRLRLGVHHEVCARQDGGEAQPQGALRRPSSVQYRRRNSRRGCRMGLRGFAHTLRPPGPRLAPGVGAAWSELAPGDVVGAPGGC